MIKHTVEKSKKYNLEGKVKRDEGLHRSQRIV
jgi:hypothetical protein